MIHENDGDVISIADLTPDPNNARKHTPRNVGAIEDSLQEVGAARSIVIDENNVVLAGNATIEAAGNVGIEHARIVEADGNEIIAVRRRGLTPEQKTRLALADNRAAELATWDPSVLAEINAQSPELLAGFFTEDELTKLLTGSAPSPAEDAETNVLGGMTYQIIVQCRDEQHQAELLARFDAESITCKALIS